MNARADVSTFHDTRLARADRTAGTHRPPYGREVADALAAGRVPNVRLFANRPDPWPLARQHRQAFGPASTLVLPADTDPETFRWPPVRELVANVTGLPGGTLQALARALVRDGMTLGYLLDADHPERSLRVVAKRGTP